MGERTVRYTALFVAALSIAIGSTVLVATDPVLERLTGEAVVVLEAVSQLGLYLLLLLVLVQSYRIARHRFETPIDETTPPHRESGTAVPVPGDELLRTVESVRDRSGTTARTVRSRLEELARDVLVAHEQYGPAAAERALAGGTWTDDDVAAAVLSDGDDPPPRSLSERIRVALGLSGRQHHRELRRTMNAITTAARADVDPAPSMPQARDRLSESPPDEHDHLPAECERTETGRTQTGHWNGITVLALLGLVVGTLYQQPPIVVAGAVGIGFAAYARLESDGDLAVTVERAVSDSSPEPGETVDVALTIRNDGNRRLADLRVVDGVPPDVAVTDGSPRLGTSLAAGETAAIRYTITARRGTHQFEPVDCIHRSVTGSFERTERITPATATTITCRPAVVPLPPSVDLPIQNQGARRAGPLATADPGPGLEFHSVREYQSGDPVGRIDWNRYARTGEVATVSFHDERAAITVVAIDARNAAYHTPDPAASEHAVDRSVTGAASAFGTLLSDGHRTGLASIGPDPLWLAPATGSDHRERGRALLSTHDAIGSRPPPSSGSDLGRFERLPTGAQILLFSPLCDDDSIEIVRRLRSSATAVTIVSPDPTTADEPERAVARLERQRRITRLRGMAVPVVDWAWDRSFEQAIGGDR